MDSLEYPNHLQAGAGSGGVATAQVLAPEAEGTPGLTPPALAGPLQRLRHRRPGRARVRPRGPCPSGDRRGAQPPARPPEALLLTQGAITGEQLSRAIAERYGLDHVDLSTYQVTWPRRT